MDLASYLLKPVQRMGKYALLLQQLMKAVTSVQGPVLQEISEDVEELQRAEEMVRFQLRHGNDLLAMDSLRDCDVSDIYDESEESSLKPISFSRFRIGQCKRTRSSTSTKRVFGMARTWWQENTASSISIRRAGSVQQSAPFSRSQKFGHLFIQKQY